MLRQGLVLPEALQPEAQLRPAQVSLALSPGLVFYLKLFLSIFWCFEGFDNKTILLLY
jgi:hypothetical protein